MALKGVNPKWKDLPDYIIGITKENWEDRGVSTLNHYYTADMVKRSAEGIFIGNQAVISEALGSMAAVPDLKLYAEDVIWSGDDTAGFLSSHRLMCVSTHATDGYYGPPTGVVTRQRVIADCACLEDAIYGEWLIHDSGAVPRQLGHHPRDFARALIATEGGPDACPKPFTPAMNVQGAYTGCGNDNEWGARYVDLLHRIMAGDFAALVRIYDRAVQLELPGGLTTQGMTEADKFWLNLRASFPDAILDSEHGRPAAPATRRCPLVTFWQAFRLGHVRCVDRGRCLCLGISHAEFGPWGLNGWGLRREFVIFDEVMIWKQIHLHTGAL